MRNHTQAVFTLLPLRVGIALVALGRGTLRPGGQQQQRGSDLADAALATAASDPLPELASPLTQQPSSPQLQQQQAAAQQQQQPKRAQQHAVTAGRLRGDQLYDLIFCLMLACVVLFLFNLNAGTLYFWMKVLRLLLPLSGWRPCLALHVSQLGLPPVDPPGCWDGSAGLDPGAPETLADLHSPGAQRQGGGRRGVFGWGSPASLLSFVPVCPSVQPRP